MSQYYETPADDAVRQALAHWLTANSADPSVAWPVEGLAAWRLHPVEEWFLAEPPGGVNRLFLVSGPVVYSFAPSNESVEDALRAARDLVPDGAR